MLGNLLKQIADQEPVNTVIHIHDDGSTSNYLPVINKYKALLEVRYFLHDHYGKQKYWALVNKVFKHRAKARYYIMLPDDDIICDNFFNKVINKWNAIINFKKITLMPSVNNQRKWFACWTFVVPKKEGEVYNTGYVDMRFICESKFFVELGELKPVDQARWTKDPLLGSGVGSQISNTLHDKGYNMYISEENLTHQTEHKSKMNPGRPPIY
jgi:glycosyltransferase involved in cell wall biosynthesis